MKELKPTIRLYKSSKEPMHTVMYSVSFVGNSFFKVHLQHMSYMNLKRTLTVPFKNIVSREWVKETVVDECENFIKWCKKKILHEGFEF